MDIVHLEHVVKEKIFVDFLFLKLNSSFNSIFGIKMPVRKKTSNIEKN